MQWEFKTVREYSRHEFEKASTRYGSMGWEMVSAQVSSGIQDVYTGFFKRPIR